ncbi:hypothetical protein QTN25_001959 [Entamoeba marina]
MSTKASQTIDSFEFIVNKNTIWDSPYKPQPLISTNRVSSLIKEPNDKMVTKKEQRQETVKTEPIRQLENKSTHVNTRHKMEKGIEKGVEIKNETINYKQYIANMQKYGGRRTCKHLFIANYILFVKRIIDIYQNHYKNMDPYHYVDLISNSYGLRPSECSVLLDSLNKYTLAINSNTKSPDSIVLNTTNVFLRVLNMDSHQNDYLSYPPSKDSFGDIQKLPKDIQTAIGQNKKSSYSPSYMELQKSTMQPIARYPHPYPFGYDKDPRQSYRPYEDYYDDHKYSKDDPRADPRADPWFDHRFDPTFDQRDPRNDSVDHRDQRHDLRLDFMNGPRVDSRIDPRVDPRADPRIDPRIDPRADPKTDPRVDPRFDPRADPKTDPRVDPRFDPRIDPRAGPKADPRFDPRVDPKADPRIDPRFDSKTDSRIDPRFDTKADPRVDPRFDPRIDPRVDPRVDPKVDPRFDPRIDPKTDPRIDPRADPKADPRLDPRFDPRADPKIDPRMDPRFDPRADPRFDPRYDYRFDPRADPRFDSRFDPRADPKIDPRMDPRFDPRFDPRYEGRFESMDRLERGIERIMRERPNMELRDRMSLDMRESVMDHRGSITDPRDRNIMDQRERYPMDRNMNQFGMDAERLKERERLERVDRLDRSERSNEQRKRNYRSTQYKGYDPKS